MPYAYERINPARHARQACAWLRAATRLLPQGFDALFAAGIGLTSRNGGNRHYGALQKNAGKGSAHGSLASTDYDKNTNKSQKKSEAILNGGRLMVR